MQRDTATARPDLEQDKNAADALWESLPSAAAAQKHFGADWYENRPPLYDIVREATHVLLAVEFGKTAGELVEWFHCDTSGLNILPPTEQEKLDFVCDWFRKRLNTEIHVLDKENKE